VETYITKPASGSSEKVILLLTDVMGICNNPKLFHPLPLLPYHRGYANTNNDTSIADDFAANGYTVVLPDMFAGDKVPPPADRKPGFELSEWLKDHQPHHVIPIIQKVMGQIRSELSMPPFLLSGDAHLEKD